MEIIDLPSYLLGAASVLLASFLWSAGESVRWVSKLIRSKELSWKVSWAGIFLMWTAAFVLVGFYVWKMVVTSIQYLRS